MKSREAMNLFCDAPMVESDDDEGVSLRVVSKKKVDLIWNL